MRSLISAALLVLFIPVQQLTAQESSGMDGNPAVSAAGFEEALFDAPTLIEILENEEAVGIRFYNVLVPPGNATGSAMAVGIRADGSELNSGKAYGLSLGFVDGKITMDKLRSRPAGKACEAMQQSGHASYSGSFTRTDMEALLELEGCEAIRATPDVTEGKETTMLITAMKIIGAKAEPLGSDPKFLRLCGHPCPSVCGPDNNYVYRFKQ